MSSTVSLNLQGESATLALVSQSSSDGITIKMPYEVHVLYIDQPHTHLFLLGWFIVRSVETGLTRWTLVVAVISIDAYPFLAFSDLTCHLEDMWMYFLVALHCLIVRRPNLEVEMKMLLHRQVKYWGSLSAMHMEVCPYNYFQWCGYFQHP